MLFIYFLVCRSYYEKLTLICFNLVNEQFIIFYLKFHRSPFKLSIDLCSRNVVYNLSLTDLTEQRRLVWYSPANDVQMCVVKGKDEVPLSYFTFLIDLQRDVTNTTHMCET